MDALVDKESSRDALAPRPYGDVVVTSRDHEAALGQFVVCEQALTVTLPRARREEAGSVVTVKLFTTSTVTVDPGSASIDGTSGESSITTNNATVSYVVVTDGTWAAVGP